jgi:glycine cleavage system transcriptional repressor
MQHLIVSVVGTDQPNIANELCQLAAHYECSIQNCRSVVLGKEFTANLLLAGTWNALAKFETALPGFEQKYDLRCVCRRTQLSEPHEDQLPYVVHIVAIEKPETIHKIAQFFANQAITIYELYVNNYKAPVTGTSMLAISLSIILPISKSLADLRENFMLFCDDHNFDAVMEPQKG